MNPVVIDTNCLLQVIFPDKCCKSQISVVPLQHINTHLKESKASMDNKQEPMQRTRLLLGDEALQRLDGQRVIVVGVGGVGSWCAESLVRSGIGHLTLVDSDCVSASNINRQLMATTSTVGQPKVDVLRRRLLDIRPDADIRAVQRLFCEETADSFQLDNYDFIIKNGLTINAIRFISYATCGL